ncbi:hypothetical protein JXA34_03505 [Patescibacteria group bacterium]|nr:hypothetical protein [Patescibacteria group bacterium]
MKFILQTGGQGTKLWPLSREKLPKQFQKIANSTSLFSYQVKTLLQAYPAEDLFVSTKEKYVKLSMEQAPQIPVKNYIVEPDAKKGRGPAEGFVFLMLALSYPNEPFMLVQTDCLREPEEEYLKMISEMQKLVVRDRKYITGGMKANYPTLGIDYLKLGKRVKSDAKLNIFEVDEYIERNNDFYKTKKLVTDFYVAMHCNHGCWYPELMLNAYKKHAPDWYKSLMDIKEVVGKSKNGDKLESIYSEMREGKTEEVTSHVFSDGYVVLLPFEWTDIGTWNSLYEFLSSQGKNYESGMVVSIDSTGSIIKSTNEKKLVAVMGVKDLVVVDTDDILLVIPRDKAEKVKEIQSELRDRKLSKYL